MTYIVSSGALNSTHSLTLIMVKAGNCYPVPKSSALPKYSWSPFPGVAIPSFHHSQVQQPEPNYKLNPNPDPKLIPNPNPSGCRPCDWWELGMWTLNHDLSACRVSRLRVNRTLRWRASSRSTRTTWRKFVRCSGRQMACDSSSKLCVSSRVSSRREFPEKRCVCSVKPKFHFGSSRHDSTRSTCRARRAVLFDKLDTAKMHGLDTSNLSSQSSSSCRPCRDVTWRAKIWALVCIFRATIAAVSLLISLLCAETRMSEFAGWPRKC